MAAKQHIIAIRTVLSKLHIKEDDKETLVSTYTNGRTVSISDMSDREAQELRNYLNNFGKGKIENVSPVPNTMNVMRRKIISKYREMNYQAWSEEKQKMMADMPKIQAHLKEHWKKELNDYTDKELAAIISVLETKWLPWFYKNKKQDGQN